MSFDTSGIGRPGESVAYTATGDTMREYAAATDDAPGGPVFAIVPVWEAIAPASRSVASGEIRKQVEAWCELAA